MRKRPRAAPGGAAPVLARGLSARAVSRGSPSCTLRSIVRHGNSRGSWKATAERWSTAATGVPSMRTVPGIRRHRVRRPVGAASTCRSPTARAARRSRRRGSRGRCRAERDATPPPGCSNERPTPRRLTPRAGVPTRVPRRALRCSPGRSYGLTTFCTKWHVTSRNRASNNEILRRVRAARCVRRVRARSPRAAR